MEFVRDDEVFDLLREQGVLPAPCDDERVYLRMDESDEVVRLHMAKPDAETVPDESARVITMDAARLPDAVEGVIHKLHLTEVLLIPVAKWRHLFDAVAFSLADNEDWQEFDAAATVERNSRDPIVCGPGDFHTVSALMRALLSDGESPEQGLMLTSSSVPLLVEVVPEGAIRMSFGSRALADEVAEAIET